MTLQEFLEKLRRFHCLGGGGVLSLSYSNPTVPGLSLLQQLSFDFDPVGFFLGANDATQRAIWRAMERVTV